MATTKRKKSYPTAPVPNAQNGVAGIYRVPKYGLGALLGATTAASNISGAASALGAGSQFIKPGGVSSALSGAAGGAMLGAKLGTIVPGIGNVVGAIGGGLIGGIRGLVKGRKDRKRNERLGLEQDQQALAEQRFAQNEANAEFTRSEGVLNQYPTEGVEGVNFFGKEYGKGGNMYSKRKRLPAYAMGGRPDYMAEGGEAIEYDPMDQPQVYGNGEVDPLSSSMGSIEGDDHSDPSGGVPMSGGERIYSDQLEPSPQLKEALKAFKINSRGTYSDIVKRVGKAEGKQESALNSDDRFEKERASKMNERYELVKELIFADQEATKPMEEQEVVDLTDSQEEFAYGGKLPNYQDGGNPRRIAGHPWGNARAFQITPEVDSLWNQFNTREPLLGSSSNPMYGIPSVDGMSGATANDQAGTMDYSSQYEFKPKSYNDWEDIVRGKVKPSSNPSTSSYQFKAKSYDEWEPYVRGKVKPNYSNTPVQNATASSSSGSSGNRSTPSVPTVNRSKVAPAISGTKNANPFDINLDDRFKESSKKAFDRGLETQPYIGGEGKEGKEGFLGKIGGFLNDNLDMIAAGVQYKANDKLIDQMPLTQETRMYNPVYMDTTRRDGLQQNRIGTSARQALRSGTAGGTQSRNALIGDVVSRAIDGSNQVSDNENQRIDRIKMGNVEIGNRANQYNTEMANQTYGDYQQNRMLQLGEKMKNRNNLTSSILGNLQTRKLMDRDSSIMKLIAERDKERGVIGRSSTLEDTLSKYVKR